MIFINCKLANYRAKSGPAHKMSDFWTISLHRRKSKSLPRDVKRIRCDQSTRMRVHWSRSRNSRVARRRQFGSRRGRRRGSRGVDQNRWRRWRRVRQRRRWQRRVGRRRRVAGRRIADVFWHRQEHVVRESGLIGARPAEMHSTAFTTGNRRSIRQGHRGVATVPTDDQGVGGGSVSEASRQQGAFFIACVEPVTPNGPVGRRVGDPGRKSRAIRPGGRISTRNIGRPGDLIDE